MLCEFSDFGADYFLAIFWLDYVKIGVEGLLLGDCMLVGIVTQHGEEISLLEIVR